MYNMLMTKTAKKYIKSKLDICKNIELVENFELALAADFRGWILHHRLGEFIDTQLLKDLNLYENRPPEELKFVTKSEHIGLHNHQREVHDKEAWKKKMSESLTGKKRTAEQRKNYSAGAIKRWQDPEERKRQSERCKCTPERKERLRQAKIGRIWWTNGKDEKCQKESPGPDWVKGRFYGHS